MKIYVVSSEFTVFTPSSDHRASEEERKKKEANLGVLDNQGNGVIPLAMVRRTYPKLFSDVLVDVKPKKQSKSSHYKLNYIDGTEKTDGVLTWVRKKKQ